MLANRTVPMLSAWLYSLLYLTMLTATFQAVVLALAVSSSGNLSVSILCCSDWHSLGLAAGQQERQQMVLLSISGDGRCSTTCAAAAAATDSLTPHLPALPMRVWCLYSAKQHQRHLILRTPSCRRVLKLIAIGLLITISTWLQTISNDLIAIKSWSRQALVLSICPSFGYKTMSVQCM